MTTTWRRWVRLAGLAALVLSAALARAQGVTCPDAAAGGVNLTRPPYAAPNDGRADASAAFRAALADPKTRVVCLPPGEYRLDEQVPMRTGQEIALLGLSRDALATRITWKAGVIPFYSNPQRGPETRVQSFSARNLTLDGGGGDTRAFNLLAQAGEGTSAELENVVVRNMTNLPIWLEGFDRVRIAKSKFQHTKDPGILRSRNVEIVDNEVSDNYDNCFSVSRGNSKVLVARNKLRNCKSSGIFVGGIFYDGRAKRKFELDAAAGERPGAACTVRSLDGDHFRYGMIDTHLTLKRGGDFVILKITGWNEQNLREAPCRLVTTVPASLARKPTSDWADGPHFGGEGAVIEDNEIDGSFGHGITLSLGVRDVVVRRNVVRKSGTYREDDGREQRRGAFGIAVLGWWLGAESGAHRYAENIQLLDNRIEGPETGGIRLGSESTGGVRKVVVKGNRIVLDAPDAKVGVLVDRHPEMPGRDIDVTGNPVRFSGQAGKSAIALRIDALANEACGVFTAANVPEMAGGGCAIRVDKSCVAPTAPAGLRCERR